MTSFTILIVGIFGLLIGSFLNVVILRLHTGRNLGGRSHCMSCGVQLTVFNLLPVVSYVIQRGRCTSCDARIAPQYFFVECATAVLFATLYAFFAVTPIVAVLHIFMAAVLVVIFVYDIRHTIIPNEMVWLLVFGALLYLLYGMWMIDDFSVIAAVGGAVLATLFFTGLWFVSRGRWIGLGDAKLVFPLALVIGGTSVFSFVVLAFWVGAAYALMAIGVQKCISQLPVHKHFTFTRYTMKSEVPFAPFLIVAYFGVLLFSFNAITFIDSIIW